MLHTLNDAWANILINQQYNGTVKTIMFVAKDKEESDYYIDLFRNRVRILTDEESESPVKDGERRGVLWYECNPGNVTHERCKDLIIGYEYHTFIITENGIKSGFWDNILNSFDKIDDIIISHEIHDIMLKSFLSKHRRKRGM